MINLNLVREIVGATICGVGNACVGEEDVGDGLYIDGAFGHRHAPGLIGEAHHIRPVGGRAWSSRTAWSARDIGR